MEKNKWEAPEEGQIPLKAKNQTKEREEAGGEKNTVKNTAKNSEDKSTPFLSQN